MLHPSDLEGIAPAAPTGTRSEEVTGSSFWAFSAPSESWAADCTLFVSKLHAGRTHSGSGDLRRKYRPLLVGEARWESGGLGPWAPPHSYKNTGALRNNRKTVKIWKAKKNMLRAAVTTKSISSSHRNVTFRFLDFVLVDWFVGFCVI